MNSNTKFSNHMKWVVAAVIILAVAAAGFFALGEPDVPEAATAAAAPGQEAEGNSADAVAKTGLAAYDKNGDGIVYQSGMHPQIVQDEPGQCPICGMDLMPVPVDGIEEGSVKIDPVTLQNMGVRTATVAVEPIGRTIRTTGRFEMDEQGERAISMKISGWIEKLHADYEGMRIRKGQPLLEIYSPDLVATQEEYLLALRNAERLEGSPAAADAARLLQAARRRLSYWDLTEAQIRRLEETGEPRRTVTYYAPSSGEVMRKKVSEGDYVQAGQPLMDIVDISKIWLIADVYEQDLAWVGVGTRALVRLPYEPGKIYEGRVDYVYHMLDPDTRAAKARIVLPGGHDAPLKPGMYATVELVGGESAPMPVVPQEAVIRTGEEEVVVLALGEGRFRPVKVEAGLASGDRVQILSGLVGGEKIVTSAQFLIDSEARLQSAVGAMVAAEASPSGHEHVEDDAVHITVSATGYAPQQVTLQAGVPAKLVFTRTEDGGCTNQVQIPAFGIAPTDLPLGEPVTFEVTPEKDGRFTFACGMDMVKGTVVVAQAGL